ncbi:hypothetical protein AB6A40_006718 [Gnathostoma spinigerum]|uniref:Uncharacterized protein n=1 Tax=Gnathostoma spinigerum TaxID=75299 RepID=A0ABD6EJ58_9BILA
MPSRSAKRPTNNSSGTLQLQLVDKIDDFASVDEIRLLLIDGAKVNVAVEKGLTPLHYACLRNYLAAARLLLVRGADANAINDDGYTPLHICAERGYVRLVKLLIEYEAHLSDFSTRDGEQRSAPDEPLRLALKNGHYECARLLLSSGVDVNKRYGDGHEISLIDIEDTQSLRLLLAYGADPNIYDHNGQTPLMRACLRGGRGILPASILIDAGADINALAMPRQDLRTPLHYAVLSGSVALLRFLIDRGAYVNLPIEYDRPSALDLAVLKDDPELITVLLKAGANPDIIHTYIGSTLHLAAILALRNQYEIMELLIRHGADVNLSYTFPGGGYLLSPFAEYVRSRNRVDVRIIYLLLSYGGRIIMRSPPYDARGQLTNLLRVHGLQPEVFGVMMDMAEQYDRPCIDRMCLPLSLKSALILRARNVRRWWLKNRFIFCEVFRVCITFLSGISRVISKSTCYH